MILAQGLHDGFGAITFISGRKYESDLLLVGISADDASLVIHIVVLSLERESKEE